MHSPTTQARLAALRLELPEALRPHVLEMREKPDELVLFVDSAAWASRLRLCLPELASLADSRRLTVRLMPRGGYRK